MKTLLVGLGNRGTMWAEIIAAHPDVDFAGVMDLDPARLERFAARWPGVPQFGDLDAALAGAKADFVTLVTPPDGHLDQARRIYGAGLALLAEKPLTTEMAEAVEIVKLAEGHRLPLTVGLNFRYLTVTQAYRNLIASGELGAPGFGQFVYLRNRNGYRPGLNRYPLTMRHPMMLEQSIHHLDLMRFVYGREVEAIACRTWNPPWSMYAHDANVNALLTFEGGVEVNYIGTWSSGWNGNDFDWRTDCADGVIIQRELFEDIARAKKEDEALTPVPIAPCEAFKDDTRNLLDAFLAALKAGTPVPCDGRDHLRTLALCFAGIESTQTGRRVEMADFYRRHGLEAWI